MSGSVGEAVDINRIEQGQRPMKEAEEGRRASAADETKRGEFGAGTGWYDVAARAEGSSGPEAYDDRRRDRARPQDPRAQRRDCTY
jgi:hypothetical protein